VLKKEQTDTQTNGSKKPTPATDVGVDNKYSTEYPDCGGLTMRQWRHKPPAPYFWAKKSAAHSDSVQILDIVT